MCALWRPIRCSLRLFQLKTDLLEVSVSSNLILRVWSQTLRTGVILAITVAATDPCSVRGNIGWRSLPLNSLPYIHTRNVRK